VECEHIDFISCGRDVVTMSDLENLSSFPHLSLSGEGCQVKIYFILITSKHDNLASNKRSVGYSCVVHYVSITSVWLSIHSPTLVLLV